MSPSLEVKLEKLSFRLDELNALMSSESATSDMALFREWTKEHSEIHSIVAGYQDYLQCLEDKAGAEELLQDPEMANYAKEEIQNCEIKLLDLEGMLQLALLPKDPNDSNNIFLEIRAGTGGDESALFAGDLFKMYSRYAERTGWKIDLISQSHSDLGGYKEIIIKISGQDVYARLKFESGGHRVQRVPETETQGRVHTSACTVAVMPEADELEEVKINPADIRIDTFRASGAGGQHVNKTDSAIRVTHLPTGIVVECQDDRSQHKNKAQALSVLAARINDLQIRERQQKEAATRKTLIGSGDRSERIRTYNFPQGRVTDHRINLTLYKLSQVMEGELDEIVMALRTEHQAELLASQAD
jgi:peptide chain release factor 1